MSTRSIRNDRDVREEAGTGELVSRRRSGYDAERRVFERRWSERVPRLGL